MKAFFDDIRNSLGDFRLLALLFVVSPLVLLLFGYAARNDVEDVEAVIVGPGARAVEQKLPPFFEVVSVDPDGKRGEAVDVLRQGEADVALVADTEPQMLIDGVSLFKAKAVQGIAQRVPQMGKPEVLFNPQTSLTVSLLPAVSGLVILVASALCLSASLARDRESGRFASYSRSRKALVGTIAGKLLFWAAVICSVTLVVGLLGRVLFDLPFRADWTTAAVAGGVFSFAALGIGAFIAAIVRSRGKAIALSVGLLVPQILLSGAIFPARAIAPGLRWFPYALPMKYVVDLFQGVMLRGGTVDDFGFPLTVTAEGHGITIAYDASVAGLSAPLVALALMGFIGLMAGGVLLHRQLRDHEPSGQEAGPIDRGPVVVRGVEGVVPKAS